MKLNSKGFMMAEVVVVSAIILVFMTGMFVTYNKIFSAYKQRISYYDTTTLYKLGYYRDILIKTNKLNSLQSDAKGATNSVKLVSGLTNPDSSDTDDTNTDDKIYLIYNAKENLSPRIVNTFNGYSINQTYKDYITYMSTAVTLNSYNYVMVLERCPKGKKTDCKYAYLEIEDEEGTI